MKIGVTGASGFVGRNLVRQLAEKDDCSVVALARDVESLKSDFPKLEIVHGDVRDIDSLRKAFAGCDVVIHLAGLFNHPELSRQDYVDVNVTGTENVLTVSKEIGVNRVIHCSTVGVASGGKPPYSENAPYSPPEWDKYETTKADGEKAAIAFGKQHDYPVYIIRPAQVYGPGDLSKLKYYKMVKKGVIVSPGKTLKHLIYIDDLCEAFYAAARVSPSSEGDQGTHVPIIIANSSPTPLTELTKFVASELGVDYPKIRLPQVPVTLAAAAVEVVFNAINKKPPIFRRSMNFFNKSVEFDISNAAEYLDFQANTPVSTGVKNTAVWYKSQNLL